jgi:hypothetical protein
MMTHTNRVEIHAMIGAALLLGCSAQVVDYPWGDGGFADTGGTGGATDEAPSSEGGEEPDDGGATDGLPKFDVDSDGAPGDPPCGCGNTEWSYIWIANSAEHTVSKINTRTMIEEGRYFTRADESGNPSRTSVTIDARAVAVANRLGGVTKIWARPENCVDKNGNGVIDTSTGPNDVLAFAEEECIAWHTLVPETTVQRPVAWTSGTLNETTCEYEDQKLWTTTGRDGPLGNPMDMTGTGHGYCGPTGNWVHRLNGGTGVVEDEFHIPESDVSCTGGGAWGYGFYGAAVDPDDNLWLSTFAVGKSVKVDFATLDYTVVEGSSYGLTVDTAGRAWHDGSQARYDEATQEWVPSDPRLQGAGGSGIAQDLQGRMWTATTDGVGWVDMETQEAGDTVVTGFAGIHRGIAVDVDGFIWAIPLNGTVAIKIDPDTYETEIVTGLNEPYTYSDMSGGQLTNVNCNPAG